MPTGIPTASKCGCKVERRCPFPYASKMMRWWPIVPEATARHLPAGHGLHLLVPAFIVVIIFNFITPHMAPVGETRV